MSVATFAALGLFFVGWGWIFRPEILHELPQFPAAKVAEAQRLREVKLDPAAPNRVQVEVNYAEGAAAAWWPQQETPFLAELVSEKQIAPVAERTGSEPLVLRGVEGPGRHGGTWIYAGRAPEDLIFISNRFSGTTLVRWSPQGYPIVPHVAKSWEIRDESREYVFHLRRGMKWSDGHPFTADDIMYFWEHEVRDPAVFGGEAPDFMIHLGEQGEIEKVDDYTLRFRFTKPNALFLDVLATSVSTLITKTMFTPAHYLRKYHPRLGDQALISRTMAALKMPSARTLYAHLKDWSNPEHPRLWPWVYRTYTGNPPYSFVRNPYYWAVDPEGRQLPYLDRLLIDLKGQDMAAVATSNGETSFQFESVLFSQYTLLMAERERKGFAVRHWYAGNASDVILYPNQNRHIDPADPDTARKAELLSMKEFRQALSLSINREALSLAEFGGLSKPAQIAPIPESPLYEPSLVTAFVEHDVERAGALLDSIGLTTRDGEGFRTFSDGSRMQFYLTFPNTGFNRVADWLCDDWGRIGLRVVPRERDRNLLAVELISNTFDLKIWNMNGKIYDLIEPKVFVASRPDSQYATAWGTWFANGGLQGNPRATQGAGRPPPEGHPMRRSMEFTAAALAAPTREEQAGLFRETLKIAAEHLWCISAVQRPLVLAVVKDGFRNVPEAGYYNWDFTSPANLGLETYFFDRPHDSPGAIAQMKQAMVEVTPVPQAAGLEGGNGAGATAGANLGRLIKTALILIVLLGVAMVAVRHPFVWRRLAIMVPTLGVISVCTFTIIQLPPGDYLSTQMIMLQVRGETADLQRMEDIRQTFHLDEPVVARYLRWIGAYWFFTLDPADQGLLQGNLGRSMATLELVNNLVGDRILLTVLVSLGTILFTWSMALPIGIYSAVRQYTLGDYVTTLFGFLGMCVPNFLLAIILMFLGSHFLGMNVSGLFSPAYAAQPEWTWGKFVDLLRHIWVPIVVLGVGGTAGMIRIMRGNLLDELRKPYVTTARAKGVRPLRLLLKYPVRLALSPFVSGIGALFPQIISGGTIVALVMSLPMVGPLLLHALLNQDMFLAGSMLMVLSTLAVVGTLVSDLLLLWLDPRIRMEGGAR